MVSVMEPFNLDKLRIEMGRMVNSDVLRRYKKGIVFKVYYEGSIIAEGCKNIESNFAYVNMSDEHLDNYDLEDYLVDYIEKGF